MMKAAATSHITTNGICGMPGRVKKMISPDHLVTLVKALSTVVSMSVTHCGSSTTDVGMALYGNMEITVHAASSHGQRHRPILTKT